MNLSGSTVEGSEFDIILLSDSARSSRAPWSLPASLTARNLCCAS